jgi:hypothetical protein
MTSSGQSAVSPITTHSRGTFGCERTIAPILNKGVPNLLLMISTASLISPARSSFGVATKVERAIDCRSVDTGDFFDGHLGIGQHLPASRRCA